MYSPVASSYRNRRVTVIPLLISVTAWMRSFVYHAEQPVVLLQVLQDELADTTIGRTECV